MDLTVKEKFLKRWEKYFVNAELPITFYYTDDRADIELEQTPSGHRCFIGQLASVRKGKSRAFNASSLGCGGGTKYLGYNPGPPMPHFEYFLSCGIPGKMEGERYVKSPEMVREMMKDFPSFQNPAEFAVFKRWDHLEISDQPEVVIFFAASDVLSGLFTLANFDDADRNCVVAPFGAGCASIVLYPYLEIGKPKQKAILGMFDVSARPFVGSDLLTFAVPFKKFEGMIHNMEESFLITPSWEKVKKRIAAKAGGADPV